MASSSATALVAYIAWTLFLLVLMEAIRCVLVLRRVVPPNGFRPDNTNLSPFMQRLARAHANCLEGFPIFGGLLIAALLTERTGVTDGLAFTLLGARMLQSSIHLLSLSNVAVNARFSAFAVQMGIAAYWSYGLLSA